MKKKEELGEFDVNAMNPDDWNSRQEKMATFNAKQREAAPQESSIPIGELAAKTEGLLPRSHDATTRNADDRVNHFIDLFERTTVEKFQGKTHMPKECIPSGRVFLWARKTVGGRPDDNNIRDLITKKGWSYASPDDYPGYAFYDDTKEINDSSGRLDLGGLVGLDRDVRIHQAELRYFERQRNMYARQYEDMTSRHPDRMPRSFNNMESYNDQFFPSNAAKRAQSVRY